MTQDIENFKKLTRDQKLIYLFDLINKHMDIHYDPNDFDMSKYKNIKMISTEIGLITVSVYVHEIVCYVDCINLDFSWDFNTVNGIDFKWCSF